MAGPLSLWAARRLLFRSSYVVEALLPFWHRVLWSKGSKTADREELQVVGLLGRDLKSSTYRGKQVDVVHAIVSGGPISYSKLVV